MKFSMPVTVFAVILVLCFRDAKAKWKSTPLSITIEPIDYEDEREFITAGSNTKVNCKGSTKTQKIDWYNPSGSLVRRLPSSRIRVQDNLSSIKTPVRSTFLSITKASVDDSGAWQCRSGNLRKNVSLCILDPIEFVNAVEEVEVLKGRSITLSCHVKGDPEPTITWLRNEEVIADDDSSSKYKVMTVYRSQSIEGLLTVTSADPEDEGKYFCQVYQENVLAADCSLTETLNITLNVNYAPIFDIYNDTTIIPQYGLINDSVDLTCGAMGFPKPSYKWYHVNDEVYTELPEKFENDVSVLTLNVTSKTIEEKYVCKASNSFGEVYQEFTILELKPPSKPLIKLENATHNELVIVWSDNSFVPVNIIEVQYYKKISKAKPTHVNWWKANKIVTYVRNPEQSYTIGNLKEDTEYWVKIQLGNEAGKSGWSDPRLLRTASIPLAEVENEDEDEENEIVTEKDHVLPSTSNGMIIGLIVLAAMTIIISSCILFIKHFLN